MYAEKETVSTTEGGIAVAKCLERKASEFRSRAIGMCGVIRQEALVLKLR